MPISVNRLEWLSDLRTDAWISQASGIPIDTIGYVRSGEIKLPTEYYKTLRNLYQRETYAELRNQGFSYHQARRFSSYAPAAVSTNITKMKSVIQQLALGRTGGMMERMDRAGEYYDPEDLYGESLVAIQKALSRSRKSFEDIEEYPEH